MLSHSLEWYVTVVVGPYGVYIFWVLYKYIQTALNKNGWGRRWSDWSANSEQRKKHVSLTEVCCLLSCLIIFIWYFNYTLNYFNRWWQLCTLCCFFSSCDNAKWASQLSAHCLCVAVLIFSLAVFQAISTLLCQLDLIFNRYFLLLAILRMGNCLYFPGCSGTSTLAFRGSVWICCGDVLNGSFPRSTYFSKRLFLF